MAKKTNNNDIEITEEESLRFVLLVHDLLDALRRLETFVERHGYHKSLRMLKKKITEKDRRKAK